MMKKTLALAGVLALALALAAPVHATYTKEGEAVPEFSVTMLSGKQISSTDLMKQHKTILITFIQTACSSCKGEIVELQSLYKKGKGGVFVLPVAVDMRTGKEFLENYKAENAVDFDFAVDPKFAVPRVFGISFTPATVLIKDGKVAKVYRGYDSEIQKELQGLFK